MLKRLGEGSSNFHFKAGMSNKVFPKRGGNTIMNNMNMINNSIPNIPKSNGSVVKAPIS